MHAIPEARANVVRVKILEKNERDRVNPIPQSFVYGDFCESITVKARDFSPQRRQLDTPGDSSLFEFGSNNVYRANVRLF